MLIYLFLLLFYNGNTVEEVTLVTAYFRVGKYDMHDMVNRSSDSYMSYFKHWARLANDLVVFCQNKIAENEILQIRETYGLRNRTSVVIIDDIFAVERKLFDEMVKLSKNPSFLEFRENKDKRSNNPEYVYVTNLKYYFMERANREFDIKTENIAWIDFGFDHGGDLYPHGVDFSYTLECEGLNKTSQYFITTNFDETPVFDIIRKDQRVAVDGTFSLCPKKLVGEAWMIMREFIFSCLSLGLMDDDQVLCLYATKAKPEIFGRKITWWWESAIRMFCNGGHMKYNEIRGKAETTRRTIFT